LTRSYWDLQLVQSYLLPRSTFGEEPYGTNWKAAPDEMIPIFRKENINVVVVRGETKAYWQIHGAHHRGIASIDKWR